jgi:signal transduction histidine kinase
MPFVSTPPILLLNSESVITYATGSTLWGFGYEKSEDMVGKHGRILWAEPEKADLAMDEFRRNGFWSGSFSSRRPDGTAIQIYAKAWKIEGENDDYQIIMLASASEREVELFALSAQPGMIALPEIVLRGIVHDLNNAFTFPFGMLQLLKIHLQPGDEKALQTWKLAEEAFSHATGIVQQMDQRIRSWMKRSGSRKSVAIGDLVGNAVKLATSGSQIKVHFSKNEDVNSVECEECGIFRVIVNLVLNARQAMSERGSLTIKIENVVEKDETDIVRPYVKISIADTGKGMSSEQLARVFREGFTTKENGHGVGLAISAHIVKEHGGRIDIFSVENEGTTFEVLLPARAEGSPPPPPTSTGGKGKTDNG